MRTKATFSFVLGRFAEWSAVCGAWLLVCGAAPAQTIQVAYTNGPAVYRGMVTLITNFVSPGARMYRPFYADLPVELRRYLMVFAAEPPQMRVDRRTNGVFDHFVPRSLNYLVWTNVIAHTNGRSMGVWSMRTHPPGWPAQPPSVAWNKNSLIWGLKGLTALSPCWEGEGASGQVPITALTRRHGYTRGHSMGPDGFRTNFAGKKVWFLTAADELVEVKVLREVVRTIASGRDYTLLLFDRDLPVGIEPIRVADTIEALSAGGGKCPPCPGAPNAMYKTEQTGAVSADIPGFTCNTVKGGDSGSPNMLPMPGELVFIGGRSTSGPSAKMQADMDELCRPGGLDPAKYQLQWYNLDAWPTFRLAQ